MGITAQVVPLSCTTRKGTGPYHLSNHKTVSSHEVTCLGHPKATLSHLRAICTCVPVAPLGSGLRLYAVHRPWHLRPTFVDLGPRHARVAGSAKKEQNWHLPMEEVPEAKESQRYQAPWTQPAANRLRETVMVLLDQRQEPPTSGLAPIPELADQIFCIRGVSQPPHLQTPRPDGQPMQSPSAP